MCVCVCVCVCVCTIGRYGLIAAVCDCVSSFACVFSVGGGEGSVLRVDPHDWHIDRRAAHSLHQHCDQLYRYGLLTTACWTKGDQWRWADRRGLLETALNSH